MGLTELRRREVLAAAGASIAATILPAATPAPVPVLDTHIHLFDPRRPQGAPYRGPRNAPSYTIGAFPDAYEKLVRKHHVVGAIKVEASPWIEDNLWVLETIQRYDIMVGMVGNMQPDAADFAGMIERFAKSPLFRGVRYGNLWRYDLVGKAGNPALLAGLRLLADAGLSLDTANQRIDLLQAVVRVSDAVPNLRIVIDHLPHFDPKPEERAAYLAVMREIGQRPNLFGKLSEVIHPVNNVVRTDLASYRERLDELTGTFGEDRVLFGSDWPNILQDTPIDNEFALLRQFYADKPRAEQEKFFWRNSRSAYRWTPRTAAQRQLAGAYAGFALTS